MPPAGATLFASSGNRQTSVGFGTWKMLVGLRGSEKATEWDSTRATGAIGEGASEDTTTAEWPCTEHGHWGHVVSQAFPWAQLRASSQVRTRGRLIVASCEPTRTATTRTRSAGRMAIEDKGSAAGDQV